MSPRRRQALKVAAISLGGIVLTLATLLIAFRIALSYLPNYRAQVQAWVSERTGLDFQFTAMDARWRFYGPELVFESAVVRSRDGQRRLVRAQQASVGFDVWTAIGTWRLAAGRITLTQPELQFVRTLDGHIELVGQGDLPGRDPAAAFKPDALPTGRLVIVDARVSFRDLKAGRGPWIVPGVSFSLKRTGGDMHLEGTAELPAKLGDTLEFSADTSGRLSAAEELQWRFSIAARDLDLSGWQEVSPKDWPAPRAGRGSFAVSGVFQGSALSELSTQVQFADVSVALPAWHIPIPERAKMQQYVELPPDATGDQPVGAPIVAEPVSNIVATPAHLAPNNSSPPSSTPTISTYQRIVFDVHLNRTRNQAADSWRMQVKNLDLSRPGEPWRRSSLEATYTRTASGGWSATAQSELLVLQNIWPLLAFAPESESLAFVRGLDAKGSVTELRAEFARMLDTAPTYSLRGRFVDLAVTAVGKTPGVEKFSGVIEGNEHGGRIDLNVRSGALDVPRVFRAPLPVDRIAGTLQWQRLADAWSIGTDELLVDTIDGHARASGEVRVPFDGSSPIAAVRAQGWDLVVRAAPRYIPAYQFPPKTLEWLDHAFVAGNVTQADFQLNGPLREHPFRNGNGLFLIKAHIVGLTLNYQPEWMPATNLTVDAEFRNVGMTAKLLSGDVNGLPLYNGVGRFVDFKDAELQLDAETKGDLAQALPFVQQGPIGPAIGEQFMALRGSGNMQAKVRLRLPLKDLSKQKITVDARLTNGTVRYEGLDQQVTELAGSLGIRDHALFAIDLRGRFLDGPVTIKGGVDGRYTGPGAGLTVTAEGRALGPSLAQLAKLPASMPLGGAMQWRMIARSPRHAADAAAKPTYRVESNTQGLSIGLPEPIGKAADGERELVAEVDATRENILLVRGALGSARALVRLQKEDAGWRFDRGGVRADGVAAALPAHTGLRIEGAIEKFVLDDWLKLKSDNPGKTQLSDYLRAANVRLNSFSFLGFTIRDTRVLLQAADTAFRADVAGDSLTGQLTIPYDFATAALDLSLDLLDVPEHVPATDAERGSPVDPRELPAITALVDDFRLEGRKVGIARVNLIKTPQGLKLLGGELRGPSFTATGNGSWVAKANNASTASLTMDIASTNVRETLQVFGYRDLLSGRRANMHAALTWPGGIDSDLLGRSSGAVKVEVSDGQLLIVDPGAGRMLGLLSVAALPRRLSLDFSDVTDKGFSFDKIHADFDLKNGDAFTNNLLVRGPQAEVGIVGRTGLGKHDYDQTAVVTGDIGGSLSVAGVVVGGPVVGAAVLAFTSLFKEPLKGVTRRYYRIAGPWENPSVDRIDKDEAKQGSAQADAAVTETRRDNTEGTSPKSETESDPTP